MHSHVSIPVQSEFVTGDLFTPNVKVNANMLFCHGWASKNTKYLMLAEKLSQLGMQSLAINLRGHGDSTYNLEAYSRQNHLEDILAAIDYLNNCSPGRPFALFGKSYGGYLSAIASSVRKIDCLIISQPALYPDMNFSVPNAVLIKSNPGIFRSKNEAISTNRALHAISQFNNPLFIIESEHDEEVLDIPKQYINASESNPKRQAITINESDHSLSRPEWLEDYYQKIIKWIEGQNFSRNL
jgi:hypothetical protein